MRAKKPVISGKPQLNRQINASLVFSLLREEGPLSRPDLAERTGVRLTSITDIVDHLLKEGVVREIGEGRSTGGRRPVLLDVNPAGRLTAGVEVAGDVLNGVIVDLAGNVAVSRTTRLSSTRPEQVSARIGSLVGTLCQAARVGRGRLAGLGAAVPGIISKDERRVVLSSALGWKDVAFQDLLKKSLGFDVHLVNNAMAGALGAYFDQPKPRARSLLYVLVYLTHVREPLLTNLGCGIVLDGRAYFGEGNLAGEVRADLDHPWAIARELAKPAPARIEDFLDAARRSPERFATVWEAFATRLGDIISWGVDFLSPGHVVIGSDVPDLGAWIETPVRAAIRKRTISGLLANGSPDKDLVPVRFAAIEPHTIARGAVVPLLQSLSLAPLLRDSVLS